MQQAPHATALISALEAAGVLTGDGNRPHSVPDDPTDSSWEPYSVFYLLPGGEVGGSIGEPDDHFDFRFQLTSVGRLAAEARDQSDTAHAAVIAASVTVDNRSIQRIRSLDSSSAVQRDDDVTPPLFYVPRVYGAWSFPTS